MYLPCGLYESGFHLLSHCNAKYGYFNVTSFSGSYLLLRKDPGRSWLRDLLKCSQLIDNDDVDKSDKYLVFML
jgi:hypothetical protein